MKTTQEQRDRQKAYREQNLEKAREAVRRWRDDHREDDREAAKRWARNNPERASAIRREYRYQTKYGISTEDYEQMLRAQDGKCAICGASPGKHRLSVDHNHETGAVRALLCISCNTGVGYFERPIAVAIRDYLESHHVV